MRRLVKDAVMVGSTLQRRGPAGRESRLTLVAALILGALLTGCSGKSGHTPGGACDAAAEPPLVPTPLDFVSQFRFGSQARSLTGIQNAFNLAAPRFNAMLSKARAHDPCAGGTVIVAIALEPDGSVAGTQVIYDDTHPDSLGPQVEREIKQMAFGGVAGDGYYTFQFPIRFNGPSPAASTAAPAAAGSVAKPAAAVTAHPSAAATTGARAAAPH
jgi:hypothetical protein